jgi:carbon-monoxide dehydrogenase medium subunit
VSRRRGDFALVGVAAVVHLAPDGTVAGARLALTGVGSTPVRARDAESALVGRRPDDDAFAEAGALVTIALDPPADVHATAAYRRHVAGVLTRRTLRAAVERTRP